VALGIVDAKAKQRGFSPHLTVASLNLTRETFRQAWSELWQQSVEFSFVGDRLTLLIYNGQNWDIRAEFSLISSQSATSSEL
jgi:2'-5' RNA ligase